MTVTLGIHVGHDGGAAVCVDGRIVVACAEERLTRFKYANGWWNSVRYCLEAAGKALSDFDLIAFSNAGPPLCDDFDGGLSTWSTGSLRTAVVDHHLSHALGAYVFSQFDNALVFVGDAGGNLGMTESAYLFSRSGFERVMVSDPGRQRCKGLGSTYEAFTNFLGFADQESGKTMALAAYGMPDISHPLFDVDGDGRIYSALEATHQWGVVAFAKRAGLNWGDPFPNSKSAPAQSIANYVQRSFETALLESLSSLLNRHPSPNVVVSGGVGLNCVANSAVRNRLQGGFFAFPACSDTGLAIGNALYGHWRLTGMLPKAPDRSMLFGRTYGGADVQVALERRPDTVPPGAVRLGELRYHHVSDPCGEAARLIAQGKILGWWQGRSESGPRALGSRSIVANPRIEGVVERLNVQIKEREWFRPFGPSVLRSDAQAVLDPVNDYRYMIEAPKVSTRASAILGECVHIDGTARVQIVDESEGENSYRDLLIAVKRETGTGALLNTSFNLREPLVETPGDAIATFLRSRLDALILDEFVCWKE